MSRRMQKHRRPPNLRKKARCPRSRTFLRTSTTKWTTRPRPAARASTSSTINFLIPPRMAKITYRKALNDALAEEIMRDENVVIIGEEVAQYNGAYKVTEGLWARFGDKRLVDAPISEAGFIGMGIGASMLGLRPVMELMFW